MARQTYGMGSGFRGTFAAVAVLLSSVAFATEGRGTPEYPYLITSADAFASVISEGVHFRLDGIAVDSLSVPDGLELLAVRGSFAAVSKDGEIALGLDTRTNARSVTEAKDLLPIVYSGSDWTDVPGSVTITAKRGEFDAETIVDAATDNGYVIWEPACGGTYELVHASSFTNRTALISIDYLVEGTGTYTDPFVVKSGTDIASTLGATDGSYYLLSEGISATVLSDGAPMNWTVIGPDSSGRYEIVRGNGSADYPLCLDALSPLVVPIADKTYFTSTGDFSPPYGYRAFVVSGSLRVIRKGLGTRSCPYVISDEVDLAQYADYGVSFTPSEGVDIATLSIPPELMIVETPTLGTYCFVHKGAAGGFRLDTRTSSEIELGFSAPLSYSTDAWGACTNITNATIVCRRNASPLDELGSWNDGEGEIDWSVSRWGTYTLSFSCGGYSTNRTFVVGGNGSGRKADPFVITDEYDLADILPTGLDDYAYISPWGGYTLVAPEGYSIEYSFGYYKLTRYIEPSKVRLSSVRQRYPWNGIVDVVSEISGMRDDHLYDLAYYIRSASITREIKARTGLNENGTYEDSLDLSNCFPESIGLDASVSAVLNDRGMAPYPSDATGMTNGIFGSVMILDISSGSTSDTYPVTYWDKVDMGAFNCDVYKTDKMVFRKIPRGNYKIGYGTSTSVNIPAQTVTTQKGYYIGVFQVTQQQYRNVCGSIPGSQSSSDPLSAVGQLSWNALRASTAASEKPTGDCFIKRVNDRAKRKGELVTGWDLPTEIQWEIAARAGVETEYVNPEGKALSDYVWCTSCAGSSVHPVGLKLPNNWGIYDAGGNVLEWCLEGYDSSVQPNMDYIDSPDPERNGWERRVKRGGGYNLTDAYSRLSQRDGCYPYETAGYNGFRLIRIVD